MATVKAIQDSVAIGGTPGGVTGSPAATPAQEIELRANPYDEYVSAGYLAWYANIPRVLGWAIDDLEETLADPVYSAMMNDAQVFACVAILKASILEDGVTFTAAETDEAADGYALAADLRDFCERVIADLATPIDNVLWNMLDALAFGNKVAEQVYAVEASPSGARQVVLRALKVKPRRSTSFVVDAFNNTIGLLGLIPGVGFPVQVGTYLTSPQSQANLLPRDKFAVLTFRPKDSDPRGTSLLRAAYDPFNAKTRLKPDYLKYLSQFASPSLMGVLPQNAQPGEAMDAAGATLYLPNGQPKRILPRDALQSALVNFRSSTALVVPFGTEVTPIEMAGNGQAFLDAFNWYDRQITTAILHQTLATMEGEHQARAAASVHQDVLATIVRQAKAAVETMLRRDVLTPLVRYNYGDKALRLVPYVTLGQVEQQDVAGLWGAAAQLKSSGYLSDDQLPAVDELINIPVREAAPAPNPATTDAASATDTSGTPDHGQGNDSAANADTADNARAAAIGDGDKGAADDVSAAPTGTPKRLAIVASQS